jgi:allophanate hydrolase
MNETTDGHENETPRAAAEAAIAADAAHADPAIWIARLPDDAIRARATELEAEGPRGRPLWGVPFAVKDNIDIAGLATTAACPGFAYEARQTAPAVARLLAAGALLIGKTNLDQFATGLVGVRSPYGVPRNGFDPARVPGGSSSGSAWAVAAGIVAFAVGTDTAGSGRVPAAFANVVGLKPTVGSISNRGMVPACASIDTISVFARSVDEALAVQRLMAGFDVADPYSRRPPFDHLRRGAGPVAARIACGAEAARLCDPAEAAGYARAAALLDATEVSVAPFLEIARLLYDGPWVAERGAGLRGFIHRQPDALLPVIRQIFDLGFGRRAVDAFAAFHRLAEVRRLAETLFAKYDALLLPTAPFCPALSDLDADAIGPNSRLGTFTNFVNLCDLAAIAVPAGFAPDGTPVGVTLLGPAWSEGRLAPIADALHRALATHVGITGAALPPPAAPDALGAEETALFCLGAHMAGLALNHRLTERGGRFLREARTAPQYRLHAIGERPAMLRALPGEAGAAIAGEVWALPTAAIGAVLTETPPPLGFGEVALEDGPCLGFLAEPAGLAGAPDITSFGGWRAWIAAGRPAG